MSEVAVSDGIWEARYGAPACRATGDVRSAVFAPPGFTLWSLTARLEAGTKLEWGTDHGDEAIYVEQGTLRVDGSVCRTNGVVVVEAGAPARVDVVEAAGLVHFGPVSPSPAVDGPFGAPVPGGHTVHVVDRSTAEERRSPTGPVALHVYADSNCPTCRINFFTVTSTEGGESTTHQHSQDEIVHVLDGEIAVGRHLVTVGASIAVPHGLYYKYRSEGPYRFINYRRDVSLIQRHGQEPILESSLPRAED